MALGIKITEREVGGEKVFIRTLNGGAHATRVLELLTRAAKEPHLIAQIGALLVVSCLCDAAGKPLYDDVDIVRDNAAISFLREFTEAALELSGLGDDAAEVKKN